MIIKPIPISFVDTAVHEVPEPYMIVDERPSYYYFELCVELKFKVAGMKRWDFDFISSMNSGITLQRRNMSIMDWIMKRHPKEQQKSLSKMALKSSRKRHFYFIFSVKNIHIHHFH